MRELIRRLWQLCLAFGTGAAAWQFVRSFVLLRHAIEKGEGIRPLDGQNATVRAAIDAVIFPLAGITEVLAGLSRPRVVSRLLRCLATGPAVSARYGPHPRHTVDVYLPYGFGLNRGAAAEQATRRSSVGLAPSRAPPPDLRRIPALVWVHGGAWAFGEPWQYASLARTLADRLGVAVLVPSYRVYPHSDAAGMADDVLRLLCWARAEDRRTRQRWDRRVGDAEEGEEMNCTTADDSLDGPGAGILSPATHAARVKRSAARLRGLARTDPRHTYRFRGADSRSAPAADSRLDGQLRRNEHPADSPSLPACVDAGRVLLVGQSAGAHLVLCAGLRLAARAAGAKGVEAALCPGLQEAVGAVGGKESPEAEAEAQGGRLTAADGATATDGVSPTRAPERAAALSAKPAAVPSSDCPWPHEEDPAAVLASLRGVVGLSGVYCVRRHFEHEASRKVPLGPVSVQGVERVSPMGPAMGGGPRGFERLSPARLLQAAGGAEPADVRHRLLGSLPPLLLLHGDCDGVVPSSSAADLLAALQELRDGGTVGEAGGGPGDGAGGGEGADGGIEHRVPASLRSTRHRVARGFLRGERYDAWVGPLRVTAVPLPGVDHTEPVLALMGHDPGAGAGAEDALCEVLLAEMRAFSRIALGRGPSEGGVAKL